MRNVVVLASPDVAQTIGRPGLLEERVGAERVVREQPMRSDVLAQALSGVPAPDSAPDSIVRTAHTAAGDASTGLVVLSLHPDLFGGPVYRHRTSGWLLSEPAAADPAAAAWIEAECDVAGPLGVEESAAQLRTVFAKLATDERAIVVYNVSTYDPTDRTHHFGPETPDPYAVVANRLVASLEHLAAEFGASVVDVDGALAELGAAGHVPRPGAFSAAAAEFITEDAVLLIDQSGALGTSLQAPVMRLEVPPYDRRTTAGVLAKWYVTPGSAVTKGDPLFDIRFDGLAYKVEMENPDERQRRAAKRAAKRRDDTSAVLLMQVLAGSDGYVYEVSAGEGTRLNVGDTAAVMTPTAPEAPVAIDSDTPPFRLGMKLKEQ